MISRFDSLARHVLQGEDKPGVQRFLERILLRLPALYEPKRPRIESETIRHAVSPFGERSRELDGFDAGWTLEGREADHEGAEAVQNLYALGKRLHAIHGLITRPFPSPEHLPTTQSQDHVLPRLLGRMGIHVVKHVPERQASLPGGAVLASRVSALRSVRIECVYVEAYDRETIDLTIVWSDGEPDTACRVILPPLAHRLIREWNAQGSNPSEIASRLCEQNIRTKYGTTWTEKTVRKALDRMAVRAGAHG